MASIELDGSIEDRGDQLRAAAAATIAAMAAGADVIYQATFFDGTWRGHADFLLRVDDPERPSRLRARTTTRSPTRSSPATSRRAPSSRSAPTSTCSSGSRASGRSGCTSPSVAAREPSSGCASTTTWRTTAAREGPVPRRRMADEATPRSRRRDLPRAGRALRRLPLGGRMRKRRRDDDHLSLVAGISGPPAPGADGPRRSRRWRSWAACRCRWTRGSRARASRRSDRVREQARIQLEGRRRRRTALRAAPARARARRSTRSAGWPRSRRRRRATCSSTSRATRSRSTTASTTCSASWRPTARSTPSGRATRPARSPRRRTAAFERLIDFVMERLERDPKLHIYHYAPYEPTALKRLMGRYATREEEVDQLLRGGVLVDLLRAVRQSLRASVESYSIKKMELFYGFTREIDLRDAGSSIVAFEQWLELGEGERPAPTTSSGSSATTATTWSARRACATGSRAPRELAAATGWTVPRPAPRAARLPEELSEAQALSRRSSSGSPATSRSTGRADARAARPLAAGPAARLAPPRGQVDVVGVPPPHGPDAGPADRRVGPDRRARADRADRRGEKGKQTWRYRFPRRNSTWAVARSSTRRSKRGPSDEALRVEIARSSRSTPPR